MLVSNLPWIMQLFHTWVFTIECLVLEEKMTDLVSWVFLIFFFCVNILLMPIFFVRYVCVILPLKIKSCLV